MPAIVIRDHHDGVIPTMERGDVLGHETMGEVVEIGRGNSKLKVGDRVVPFTIAWGECFFCRRGYYSGCKRSHPNAERLQDYGAILRPACSATRIFWAAFPAAKPNISVFPTRTSVRLKAPEELGIARMSSDRHCRETLIRSGGRTKSSTNRWVVMATPVVISMIRVSMTRGFASPAKRPRQGQGWCRRRRSMTNGDRGQHDAQCAPGGDRRPSLVADPAGTKIYTGMPRYGSASLGTIITTLRSPFRFSHSR
jgi:hypothetical protein